jgi:hypothetical protein
MSQVPSPQKFFLETPPYHEFMIGQDGVADLLRLQFFTGTLDTHCVECDRDSVFQSMAEPLRAAYVRPTQHQPVEIDEMLDGKTKAYIPYNARTQVMGQGPFLLAELEEFVRSDRVFEMMFTCTRDAKHALYFFFRIWSDKVAKVGQSPSLADLETTDISKYRKLLGNERIRELSKAIGLHAHGVGIGAFVYLRRIFEELIDLAHDEASKKPGWDSNLYARSRMDERIVTLERYLPSFLVENRGMYSILSRGVHELSETECLRFFEPLKGAIELILDEKLAQLEREEKTRRTARSLAEIKGQIAPGGTEKGTSWNGTV